MNVVRYENGVGHQYSLHIYIQRRQDKNTRAHMFFFYIKGNIVFSLCQCNEYTPIYVLNVFPGSQRLRPLNAKASFSGRSKKYIKRLFQEITETLNGVN